MKILLVVINKEAGGIKGVYDCIAAMEQDIPNITILDLNTRYKVELRYLNNGISLESTTN